MTTVVTGVGVTCSIGSGVDDFEASLRRGCSGIVPDPWGSDGPPFGAVIDGFTLAGALEARSSLPRPLLDRAERAGRRAPRPVQVAIATALEAWQRAGLHDTPLDGERVAIVVAGNNLTTAYAEGQRASFARNPAYLPGRFALHVQDSDHVGTLSEVFSIRGEGFTVGGASASGNLAIIQAARLLELGVVDACLIVGALADLTAMEMQAFVNLGAMACRRPGMPCRPAPPFHQARRGFILGQGCASLVLESEASTVRRGARSWADVAGYAAGLDANRLANPSEAGEAAAMIRAIAHAGLEPHHIAYVNTHGSGSSLGDVTELAALRRGLGRWFEAPWLNATKALTGHCLGAAGVLEAAASVIQIRGEFVHPNPELDDPIDRECRFAGAVAVHGTIPFALSNSFGFGGINTTIVFGDPRARVSST